jgi:cholesterol transport system auxiliary component
MNKLLAMLLALTLGACSLGPANKDTPATFDFGSPHNYTGERNKIHHAVLVYNVAAPDWLDTQVIVYRLNYQDGARQLSYANSRWAAPPAALLTQRLRSQLATVTNSGIISVADSARADFTLRIELDDFSQVFDSANTSRAVVVARASIVNVARRTLQAQKSFSIEHAAATPNAEGGVRALAAAGDELIEAVVAWTAASLAQEKK